jgi:hypothetical protein
LGFLKGDVLIIEEKSESGNWKGRLVKKTVAVAGGKTFEYSKTGAFPYRYVEEIDEPDEYLAVSLSAKAAPATTSAPEKTGWNVNTPFSTFLGEVFCSSQNKKQKKGATG